VRILAVAREPAELTRVTTLLKELGHDVRSAKSDAEAREALNTAQPQIVVVGLELPAPVALELIRHIRRQSTQHWPYVMALSRPGHEDHLDAAYVAGCDGDLRAPLSSVHVKSRLASAERICGRLDPRASSAPAGAPVPATPATPFDPVIRSTAWQSMASELKNMASTFLGIDAARAAIESAPKALTLARGILLSNVEHQLELRVGLATDAAGANALTVHMFGEANPELEGDMLGELANMAMGTLKTALARDELPFTGGLPEIVSPAQYYEFGATSQHQEAFVLVAQGARVIVRVGLTCRKNALIPVMSLREGMVLGKDVFNARGMLLVGAGTRLSSTAAERLRQALPEKQSVEVASGIT
jgi:CheY-like chemotaxis protein